MAYSKQNFEDGQVLTAADLNHMETGIKTAHDSMVPAAPTTDLSRVLSYGSSGFQWIEMQDGDFDGLQAEVLVAKKRATNWGKFLSVKPTTIDINTSTNEITINEGRLYCRAGAFNIATTTVSRYTDGSSAWSYLVYDTSNSTVKSIKYGTMNDDQILIAILCGNGYEADPNANFIQGKWSVNGVVYPETVNLSDLESRLDDVETVANAANTMATIAKNRLSYTGCYPISYKSTLLDINTSSDEITVNACKIYGRSGLFDVPQQTVKRNTESAISYLVYDTSVSDTAKRIKSIKYGTMTETQILVAILCGGTGGYEGNSNTNFIPGRWSVDGVVYPEPVGLSDLENRVGALENVSRGGFPLRWYALGDSITRGMYGYNGGSGVDTENCWVSLAAGYNGWTLTNKGVSGSGYLAKGGSDPETDAREQADSIDFSEADLVTLAYGVNDWLQNNGVGSMEDNVATGGTFISNMRYCIEKIIGDNPTVKIVVISPINCRSGCTATTNWGIGKANGAGTTLEDIFEAERMVCEYYGIEFVDMLHSSVVNRLNITTVLPDSVHPSRECHKQMARELSRKIMG